MDAPTIFTGPKCETNLELWFIKIPRYASSHGNKNLIIQIYSSIPCSFRVLSDTIFGASEGSILVVRA